MRGRRYRPLRRDRLGERQVAREVTRHLSWFEREEIQRRSKSYLADVCGIAEGIDHAMAQARNRIDELGSLHRYTTSKAATIVKLAQDLITTASQSGQWTTAKQEEFRRLTKAYLDDVCRVTQEADQVVIQRLREELNHDRSGH